MTRIGDILTPVSIQLPEPGTTQISFQTGRLLTAIVRSAMDNGLVLDINGQTVQARSNVALTVGEQLTLQVMRTQPDVLLKVMPESSSHSATVRQLLRQILPRQRSLPETLRPLRALAEQADMQNQLAETVRGTLATLIDSVPDAAQLAKPDLLKRALENSGVFMEAHLAAADTQAAATDLKAAILRLLAALQEASTTPPEGASQPSPGPEGEPTPSSQSRPTATRQAQPGDPHPGPATMSETHDAPEKGPATALLKAAATGSHADTIRQLLQHTGDSLARVQLMQLHTANPSGGRIDWLFELPIIQGTQMDVVQLRIEEDEEASNTDAGSTSRVFQVQVFFDFESVGQLAATIRLHGERVNTSWWAERPATVELINRELPKFEAVLKDVGLKPGHVACRQAKPTKPSDRLPILRAGILNEKA